MRYADVLLMYAEAKVELGQGTDPAAVAAFNLVRARVNMPTVTTLTQAVVRNERRVELAFEGLRLFDIRRWKIAETVMPSPAVCGIDYINAAGSDDPGVSAGIGAAVPGAGVSVGASADGARSEPEPEAEHGLLAGVRCRREAPRRSSRRLSCV